MAAYTSTQTGLWNDSATWGGGGYPSAAGDTATIAHEVVYNLTDSNSEFYGNVTINTNGHFRHLTGTHLNMNGTIFVNGGTYELVDDVTVAFTGDNNHDHGLHINNHDRTTLLARGTTNVAETRMSTSGDAGDYYIPVDDASDFQTGDWISVYFRYTDLKSREDFLNEENYPKGAIQGEGVLNTGQYGNSIFTSNIDRFHNEVSHNVDEGFIIHDIDNNNIYPRDLVGPDSSIESTTTNKITVAQSKVFRQGQRIIFGHGSKRTASKITSINYRTHQITLEDNLSSTDVVGESVYLGALKIHKYKRTVVRCNAHQVVSTANASSTTLTLNNVSDFSVGDKFYVEHGVMDESEWSTVQPDNTSWRDELNERHEITAINGNTLTFTPALPYKAYSGYFVYKANRRITVRAATDDLSDGTCKPFFYCNQNTSTRTIDGMTRYRRKMILKDVEFLGLGNSSSTYQYWPRGGFNDGYWRYSHSIENVVLDGMSNSQAYYCRFDSSYYQTHRNFINANFLRAGYGSKEGMSITNSAFLNNRYGAEQLAFGQYGGKCAYNRWTRVHDYFRIYNRSIGQNNALYQLYVEIHNNLYWNYRMYMTQCHFKVRYYPVRGAGSPESQVRYIKIEHLASDSHKKKHFVYNDNSRMGYYSTQGQSFSLRELDYEIGNDYAIAGGLLGYDRTQGAYSLTHVGPSNNYYCSGYYETIMLKPNETVKIKFEAKIHENNPNSNWQYRPHVIYLLSGHQSSHRHPNRGIPYLNVTGGDYLDYDFDFVGDTSKLKQNILYPQLNYGAYGAENYDNSSLADSYSSRDAFTSKDEFMEYTITVKNEFPFSTPLTFGLGSVKNDGAYGWYFKPYVVARDQGDSIVSKLIDGFNRFLPTYVTKSTVAKRQKRRIGGARL